MKLSRLWIVLRARSKRDQKRTVLYVLHTLVDELYWIEMTEATGQPHRDSDIFAVKCFYSFIICGTYRSWLAK